MSALLSLCATCTFTLISPLSSQRHPNFPKVWSTAPANKQYLAKTLLFLFLQNMFQSWSNDNDDGVQNVALSSSLLCIVVCIEVRLGGQTDEYCHGGDPLLHSGRQLQCESKKYFQKYLQKYLQKYIKKYFQIYLEKYFLNILLPGYGREMTQSCFWGFNIKGFQLSVLLLLPRIHIAIVVFDLVGCG